MSAENGYSFILKMFLRWKQPQREHLCHVMLPNDIAKENECLEAQQRYHKVDESSNWFSLLVEFHKPKPKTLF